MVAQWLNANFLIKSLGFESRYRHFLGDLLLQVAAEAASAGSYPRRSKAKKPNFTFQVYDRKFDRFIFLFFPSPSEIMNETYGGDK